MKWYLVRHGETHFSKFKVPYGEKQFVAKILPEAVSVIGKIGEYLKKESIDFAARSELLRCKETAKIITSITGKEFLGDKRLNEFYKETFQEFKSRIQSFIQETQVKNYQNIVVCTHGANIAGIKHLLVSGNFTETQLIDYPSTGTVVIVENQKHELIDFNKL